MLMQEKIPYKVIDEEVLSEECFEKARNIALEYNNNLDYELDCFIKLIYRDIRALAKSFLHETVP